MKLQTKYFGEVECDEEAVINFPAGLPGLDDEHSYAILPFEGSGGSMFCLQSIVTPGLALVALDPFSLDAGYQPVLQESELKQLGVTDWQELSYCVLCVVKNPVSASTVNLKCPIAIHPQTRQARQIIMESDTYEMRHPLAQFGPGEEAAPC